MKIKQRTKRKLLSLIGEIINKIKINPNWMEATHFVNDKLRVCAKESREGLPIRTLWEYSCKSSDQEGTDLHELNNSIRPVYLPEYVFFQRRGYKELEDRRTAA